MAVFCSVSSDTGVVPNQLTEHQDTTVTSQDTSVADLPDVKTNVRWKMLLLLSSSCFISFFSRTNLSVAAKPIMDQSGLSETQVGMAFTGFMIAYTVFQLPAGWLLDRFGARIVLSTAAFGWALTTAFTGVVGSLRAAGGVTLLALVLIRIGLGVFEAPSFPGAVRVISRWFPDSERGVANSWMMTAANLAPSVTTPLVAMMVAWAGWQSMFMISALPALLIGILWLRFGRNDPRDHPQISREELRHIGVPGASAPVQSGSLAIRAMLRDRSMLALSFSYFCAGYVSTLFLFWFYLYLVSAKGFSVLEGGWLASVPFLACAFATPLGGLLADRWSAAWGALVGVRRVVVLANVICAASVIAGSYATSPYVGLAFFSLSLAAIGFCDNTYWTASIWYSQGSAATAAGIMNTWANLGGVVSTALAPWLVKWFGWPTAIGSCSILALAGATAWYLMREPAYRSLRHSPE